MTINIAGPHPFGEDLEKWLGLDPKMTRVITVEATYDGFPTVTVVRYLPDQERDTTQRFHLTPIPDDDEGRGGP